MEQVISESENPQPETIPLINYEALYRQFLAEAKNYEEELLEIGTRNGLGRKLPEPQVQDFKALHHWLAAFVIALQAVGSTEQLEEFRQYAADVLERVAKRSRALDEPEETCGGCTNGECCGACACCE